MTLKIFLSLSRSDISVFPFPAIAPMGISPARPGSFTRCRPAHSALPCIDPFPIHRARFSAGWDVGAGLAPREQLLFYPPFGFSEMRALGSCRSADVLLTSQNPVSSVLSWASQWNLRRSREFRRVVCQIDRLRRTLPASIRTYLNDLPKTMG